MDAQVIDLSLLGKGDRVVQILRILPVDRDRGERPQVQAAGCLGRIYRLPDPLHLLHHILRKAFRQAVGPDQR